MPNRCYIAAIDCEIVFKTLPNCDLVGVWWVNPVCPSQVLHVGHYHAQRDAWQDLVRRDGVLWADDATCLQARQGVRLNTQDLAAIRAFVQQSLGNNNALAA